MSTALAAAAAAAASADRRTTNMPMAHCLERLQPLIDLVSPLTGRGSKQRVPNVSRADIKTALASAEEYKDQLTPFAELYHQQALIHVPSGGNKPRYQCVNGIILKSIKVLASVCFECGESLRGECGANVELDHQPGEQKLYGPGQCVNEVTSVAITEWRKCECTHSDCNKREGRPRKHRRNVSSSSSSSSSSPSSSNRR